jgi:hypothetical protein
VFRGARRVTVINERIKERMEVVLAKPRGFCAGVVRAIDVVEEALKVFGPPVYVLHEIVHNQHVVNDLRGKGAVFTEDLAEPVRSSLRCTCRPINITATVTNSSLSAIAAIPKSRARADAWPVRYT